MMVPSSFVLLGYEWENKLPYNWIRNTITDVYDFLEISAYDLVMNSNIAMALNR